MKPTTGKYSVKPYHCQRCGYAKEIGTNHWGECYGQLRMNMCPDCGDVSTVWICDEPIPEGFDKPEPWQPVKVTVRGAVLEIGHQRTAKEIEAAEREMMRKDWDRNRVD